MKDKLRQSMAWLHTWAGLITGWALFVIFVGGTLACFDQELDYWMRPALQQHRAEPVSLDASLATLRKLAPHASVVYITPPDARDPAAQGFVFEPGKPYIEVALDPHSGAVIPPTMGGTFFFTLHYDLQAGNVGLYLVGLVGMLMLVAIVSGVIVHRRIFTDLFVFRPRAGGQRAWLDGHNVTAVLGLPFHLMIAYTGVAIFVSSYMTAGVQIAYQGDQAKFFSEVSQAPERPLQHRAPAQLASLDAILADAVKRLGGPSHYLSVQNPQDSSATVSVLEAGDDKVAGGARTLYYDGVSGAYLSTQTSPSGYRAYEFLSGLHRVQFGGSLMRWLYFVLGLAGCVMLASGMQVWVSKRAKQVAAAGIVSGYGLVRALNVGVVGGLPLAAVVPLYANRLLSPTLAARDSFEEGSFWISWILAVMWAWARLGRGKPWRDLFIACGVLLLGVPLLNAIVTPRSSLLYSFGHDWRLAGVDLTAFVLGLGFVWLGAKCGHKTAAAPTRRPSSNTRSEHDEAIEEALL